MVNVKLLYNTMQKSWSSANFYIFCFYEQKTWHFSACCAVYQMQQMHLNIQLIEVQFTKASSEQREKAGVCQITQELVRKSMATGILEWYLLPRAWTSTSLKQCGIILAENEIKCSQHPKKIFEMSFKKPGELSLKTTQRNYKKACFKWHSLNHMEDNWKDRLPQNKEGLESTWQQWDEITRNEGEKEHKPQMQHDLKRSKLYDAEQT